MNIPEWYSGGVDIALQKPTNIYQKQNSQDSQNSQNSQIQERKPYHYRAIELKLSGCTYRVIAQTLTKEGKQITRQRIKEWFERGGICYEPYQSKERDYSEELKERLEIKDRLLQEFAMDALVLLGKKVCEDEDTQAAKILLDRAWGKPAQSINITESVEEKRKTEAMEEIGKMWRTIAESKEVIRIPAKLVKQGT